MSSRGKNYLPRPAGSTSPNAAQGNIRLLCSKGPLLAHIEPCVHQDSLALFCKAAFQLGGPQHILVPGAVPPQGQDFVLLEFHGVPVSPFLQPIEVPLDGSTTLCLSSYFSQFGVISKLGEGTRCPIIRIVNEDAEQDWTQY